MSDQELRVTALQLALKHYENYLPSAKDVTQRAEEFYKFLKG